MSLSFTRPAATAHERVGYMAAFSFLEALDGSDIAIAITDGDARIVWASEAIETYFHLSRGDVIGIHWAEFITCFMRPLLLHPVPKALYESLDYNERVTLDVQSEISHARRHLAYWSRPVDRGTFVAGHLHHFVEITDPPVARRAPTVFDLASRTLADEGK